VEMVDVSVHYNPVIPSNLTVASTVIVFPPLSLFTSTQNYYVSMRYIDTHMICNAHRTEIDCVLKQ
jgi:hypothetical protein